MVEGDGVLWRAEEFARGMAVRPDKLDRLVVAIDPPSREFPGAQAEEVNFSSRVARLSE